MDKKVEGDVGYVGYASIEVPLHKIVAYYNRAAAYYEQGSLNKAQSDIYMASGLIEGNILCGDSPEKQHRKKQIDEMKAIIDKEIKDKE